MGAEGQEPNDATPFLPERPSLAALREAAAGCRGCHLWRPATQTVFGDGPEGARIVLVGEQPAIARTSRAGRSWGPPGASSTAVSWLRASTAVRHT